MATSPLTTAGLQYDLYSKQWGTYGGTPGPNDNQTAAAGFTPAAVQPTSVAGFDPTELGLSAHMVGVEAASEQNSGQGSAGAQSGWFKSMGDGKTQQYDMAGNDLGITQDKSRGTVSCPLLRSQPLH